MLPKLHYALDTTSIEETLACLMGGVGEEADVIEMGSSIIFTEGNRVLKYVKTLYPNKEIVADIKMLMPTARGSVPPLMDAGADAVIACSSKDTNMIQVAVDEIYSKRQKKMYMYIHLENGEGIQKEWIDKWKEAGIQNVIYHSVNPDFMWNENDTENIGALCGGGLQVSVTGKLTKDKIRNFKGLPIYSFIIGSAIIKSENPLHAIKELKGCIKETFS